MGYRSDIVIAFTFKTKEQIDEVLAIYRMHRFVQAYNLAEEWKTHDWGECWGLTYSANSVKWYDGYEDVQGVEYMKELVETFAEERGEDIGPIDADGKQQGIVAFPYAYRKLRIGEEDDDVEQDSESNSDLSDELWDRISLHREINTSF